MNIQQYVKDNYDKLPRSKFDNFTCVIVKEVKNEDHGYGHHIYEGIGVDKNGDVFWCYSSGCSCSGGPTVDTITNKVFKIDGKDFDLDRIKPEDVKFSALEVEFNTY